MTWQNNNTSKSCIFNYLEKYMFAIKSYQIRKLYANINIPLFSFYIRQIIQSTAIIFTICYIKQFIFMYSYSWVIFEQKNLTLCDLSQKHFMKMTLQIPYISLCIVSSSGLQKRKKKIYTIKYAGLARIIKLY